MARKRSSKKRTTKKRAKRAPRTVYVGPAVVHQPALEWASENRYGLAAAAVGAAALVYFWPRPAEATQLPVPTPAPAPAPAPVPAGPPPLTPAQIVQMQTEQQRDLGMKIGLTAFALVAAGTIYYATK